MHASMIRLTTAATLPLMPSPITHMYAHVLVMFDCQISYHCILILFNDMRVQRQSMMMIIIGVMIIILMYGYSYTNHHLHMSSTAPSSQPPASASVASSSSTVESKSQVRYNGRRFILCFVHVIMIWCMVTLQWLMHRYGLSKRWRKQNPCNKSQSPTQQMPLRYLGHSHSHAS